MKIISNSGTTNISGAMYMEIKTKSEEEIKEEIKLEEFYNKILSKIGQDEGAMKRLKRGDKTVMGKVNLD